MAKRRPLSLREEKDVLKPNQTDEMRERLGSRSVGLKISHVPFQWFPP